MNRIPPPKTLHILPGTDHFFGGREQEVGKLVAEFLTSL
jgi:alpha/beta superfamily hydrolase